LQPAEGLPRVAIIGVGHELRCDDAAGLRVIKDLSAQFTGFENLSVFSAGSAPEICSGVVRRFSPDLVLVVDAANLDESPGTVSWIEWKSIGGGWLSTHNYPLSLLAGYLEAEMSCEVAFLGIQPLDTSIGTWMSPDVEEAVHLVSHDLYSLFTDLGMCS
jgi:hydrogenase maturation protease HycI